MTELATSRRITSPIPDATRLQKQLVHARAAARRAVTPVEGSGPNDGRQRLDHDVLHELSTIMLLASLVIESADVGTESRRRARQIITEARWIEKLVRSCPDGV